MGNPSSPSPKNRFELEVEGIMSDLLTPGDQRISLKWESRPLRDDDPYWEYPKYLDDGSPRFYVVKLTFEDSSTLQFGDMEDPAWHRDCFIADWASDEISEETREPRPECPAHPNTVMLAHIEGERAVWKCTRNQDHWCDVGSYWTWRNHRAS
jgi:hypothetical protein